MSVELDPASKTLGLEERVRELERKDPVRKVVRIRAGETCRHWKRSASGGIDYMDERVARVAPCRWCMGLGTVLANMEITVRDRGGAIPAAEDLAEFEYARQHVEAPRVRGRRVA